MPSVKKTLLTLSHPPSYPLKQQLLAFGVPGLFSYTCPMRQFQYGEGGELIPLGIRFLTCESDLASFLPQILGDYGRLNN